MPNVRVIMSIEKHLQSKVIFFILFKTIAKIIKIAKYNDDIEDKIKIKIRFALLQYKVKLDCKIKIVYLYELHLLVTIILKFLYLFSEFITKNYVLKIIFVLPS